MRIRCPDPSDRRGGSSDRKREHRPFPPQIAACEIPAKRLASRIVLPGEKLTYDPLTLRFKVDEDLKNWMELQNWMVGLGFPDNFGQYKDLISNKSFGENSTFSDATLIILNSNMNSNFEVVFKDAFPTSLSELAFDSTSADIDFITADVTFRYLSYTYRKFTTAT